MELFRKEIDGRTDTQKKTFREKYRNIIALLSITVVALSVFLLSLGALIEFFPTEFPENIILSRIPLRYISWFMLTFGITVPIINVIWAARKAVNQEKAENMLSTEPIEVKRQALRDLRLRRNRYARSSRVNQYLWNFLTLGIIVLSGLSSLFSAYDTVVPRWLPMATSAVVALFGIIIVQFRIRDVWQLREQGRIEAEMLVAEGHLIDIIDSPTALQQAVALRKRAHALEMKQLNQFFVETTGANP
jgi:hypothetical protein